MAVEVRVERLLGVRVVDPDGRRLGRIEELHARRRGDALVVSEVVLDTAGMVERLALGPVLRALLGSRLYPDATRYTVEWDELDLKDPARPQLRVRLEALRGRERGRRRPWRASA